MFSASEMQGVRPNQEDAISIVVDQEKFRGKLFAIFDGHGGNNTSRFAAANLAPILAKNLTVYPSIEDSLAATYQELHRQVAEKLFSDGCTALVSYVTASSVYFANAGDSRAVLFRGNDVMFSTTDHKPTTLAERVRIQDLGGFVTEKGRVTGELACSRALGDVGFQPYVSYVPDITRGTLPLFILFVSIALS